MALQSERRTLKGMRMAQSSLQMASCRRRWGWRFGTIARADDSSIRRGGLYNNRTPSAQTHSKYQEWCDAASPRLVPPVSALEQADDDIGGVAMAEISQGLREHIVGFNTALLREEVHRLAMRQCRECISEVAAIDTGVVEREAQGALYARRDCHNHFRALGFEVEVANSRIRRVTNAANTKRGITLIS